MSEETKPVDETTEEPAEDILDLVVPDRIIKMRDQKGVVRDYTIREMKGDALGDWMNLLASKVGQADSRKKKKKSEDFQGLHSELISRCLYDREGNVVPKAMINRWGSTALNKLFDMCQEVNGLKGTFEDTEGKD